CQLRSMASSTQLANGAKPTSNYVVNPNGVDYVTWCIENLPAYPTCWIENVLPFSTKTDPLLFDHRLTVREIYNAAQFTSIPLQNRNRIIAGKYNKPKVLRRYR